MRMNYGAVFLAALAGSSLWAQQTPCPAPAIAQEIVNLGSSPSAGEVAQSLRNGTNILPCVSTGLNLESEFGEGA